MIIRKIIGWLMVLFAVSQALIAVWEGVFNGHRMGLAAVLVNMFLFIAGALLIQWPARAGTERLVKGQSAKFSQRLLDERASAEQQPATRRETVSHKR